MAFPYRSAPGKTSEAFSRHLSTSLGFLSKRQPLITAVRNDRPRLDRNGTSIQWHEKAQTSKSLLTYRLYTKHLCKHKHSKALARYVQAHYQTTQKQKLYNHHCEKYKPSYSCFNLDKFRFLIQPFMQFIISMCMKKRDL